MRLVRPKQPEPRPIKLTPGATDSYGNAFAAVARCACGHDSQLSDEWVQLAVGFGAELEKARARLRCRKCGGRMPRIEVYRVAR
jgi:hypothetical protein